MDSLSPVAARPAYANEQVNPGKPDLAQVNEFERLMTREPQSGTAQDRPSGTGGFDRYINGADSPSQWLSETLIKAGREVSSEYQSGVKQAAMKMEQLDPNDPMMLPKLANLQMQIHNATFQLQFTSGLVTLANSGVKTLFNLQG